MAALALRSSRSTLPLAALGIPHVGMPSFSYTFWAFVHVGTATVRVSFTVTDLFA